MKQLLLIYLFVVAFTWKPGLIPIGDWSALINYAMAVLKTSAKWWFVIMIPYLLIYAAFKVEENNKK